MGATLLLGALGDQGGTGMGRPDEVDTAGGGVLLEVHELLGSRQAAAAVLDRPVEPGVPRVVQRPLPSGVVRAGPTSLREGAGDRRRAPRGRTIRGAPRGRPRRPPSSAGPSSGHPGLVPVSGGAGANPFLVRPAVLLPRVETAPSPHRDRPCPTPCGAGRRGCGSRRAARSGRGRWTSTPGARRAADGRRHRRNSTTATGTAPRRRSVAAHHRRAADAGVSLERGPDVVGPNLEPAADDGLIGPPDDEEEPVGVEPRQIGGAHPPASSPSWPALTSRSPSVSAATGRPVCWSTTRSSHPAWAAADAAPLGRSRRRRGPRGSSRRRSRRIRWPRR